MIKTVLFDLDGTFIDTANDLISTANEIYSKNNKPSISYEEGREIASDGIRAFLKKRFDEKIDNFNLLSEDFLGVYKKNFLNNPILFDDFIETLSILEKHEVRWGIVTNKARYFAEKIIFHHELDKKCSVLMCGDDIGFKSKPSPDLLIEACRIINLSVSEVIYVGDGLRDIQSAKAANIKSVLACYGYLKKTDSIYEWGSDYIINNPKEILSLDCFSFDNGLS